MGLEISGSYVRSFHALGLQPHRSGFYYQPPHASGTGAAATIDGLLQYSPLFVPSPGSYDRIVAHVTGAAGAGVVRLGIANDDGSLYPGSLLLEAGTIDATSATVQEITIDQHLGAGVYWLMACAQGGTPTMRTYTLGASIVGTNNNSFSGTALGYGVSGVSGAFDSAAPTITNMLTSLIRVMLRRA